MGQLNQKRVHVCFISNSYSYVLALDRFYTHSLSSNHFGQVVVTEGYNLVTVKKPGR